MSPGASPDRRTVVRLPVSEQVTLLIDGSTQNFPAKLLDTSPCGARLRHEVFGLDGDPVAIVEPSSKMTRVRPVWTAVCGGMLETGFMTEEAFLIAALQAGDNDALVPLLSPYMRQLRTAIKSIVHDRADAEDVMQESVLKVLLHATQFHPGQSFKAWLLQIGIHEALKLQRQNRRRVQFTMRHEDEAQPQEELPGFIDPAGSPADAMAWKELEEAFSAALRSMDGLYSQVFILRQIREMTMAEIAAELGIKIDTANTRLHRARLRLYGHLQEMCPFPPRGTRQNCKPGKS